jgi:2'-5' RNA ligase
MTEGGREAIAANEPLVDTLVLDPARDFRRGISLILPVRPEESAYSELIAAMSGMEPDQYYYPIADLHVTIFDFVSAREGFAKDAAREAVFLDIASRACAGTEPFELRLEGIAFSREAGMMAGYDGGALVDLRSRIRAALSAAGIKNDERYRSRSAHCSFMRFAAKLRSPRRFLGEIEAWEEVRFGAASPGAARLVEHDWYNRQASLRDLGICRLAAGNGDRYAEPGP